MGLKIAEEEDIETVVKLGMNFLEASPHKNIGTEEGIRNLATRLIQGDRKNGIILLHDDNAFLCGVSTPSLFGDQLVAAEVAWWVEPEARGNGAGKVLLDAFEYWAEQIGCKSIMMMSLDPEVGQLYEKFGYTLREYVYMKAI